MSSMKAKKGNPYERDVEESLRAKWSDAKRTHEEGDDANEVRAAAMARCRQQVMQQIEMEAKEQKMLLEKLCHLMETEDALKIVYPEIRSWIQKLRDR